MVIAFTLDSTLKKSISEHKGFDLSVYSPIDGKQLYSLSCHKTSCATEAIENSYVAFSSWRDYPAPVRGELVRLYGNKLRKHKDKLGELITVEAGKILEEGKGEVQEMIDICDFAVGLSRQLYGLTIASERPDHTMQEHWLPLGVVGIISAFNFPAAVWSWNAMLALVCGNSIIWKPSEKTPGVALYCNQLLKETFKEFESLTQYKVPEHLSQVLLGDAKLGDELVHNPRVALVSATGSTRMGKIVAPKVSHRFGKVLLELGGNNAAIISKHASLDIALNSVIFGAVGTAGQRCTTTRRLFIHESCYDDVVEKLTAAYKAINENKIGNPLKKDVLVGPLIDAHAFETMQSALDAAKKEGGKVMFGKRVRKDISDSAYYAEAALVSFSNQASIMKQETFAPILYAVPYKELEEAVFMNNDVPHGLSASIFTNDLREAQYFRNYCDTGIANVNIGTSGAEIGGAFGGEKETGGGRESGTDCWKNYMRRQTSTTYFGYETPALAQGIEFDL